MADGARTGWSPPATELSSVTQRETSPETSSGPTFPEAPELKRARPVLADAMSAAAVAAPAGDAGGNLLHLAQKVKPEPSPSRSVRSAGSSSSRLTVLRAKLDLENLLVQSIKQEAAAAKAKLEYVKAKAEGSRASQASQSVRGLSPPASVSGQDLPNHVVLGREVGVTPGVAHEASARLSAANLQRLLVATKQGEPEPYVVCAGGNPQHATASCAEGNLLHGRGPGSAHVAGAGGNPQHATPVAPNEGLVAGGNALHGPFADLAQGFWTGQGPPFVPVATAIDVLRRGAEARARAEEAERPSWPMSEVHVQHERILNEQRLEASAGEAEKVARLAQQATAWHEQSMEHRLMEVRAAEAERASELVQQARLMGAKNASRLEAEARRQHELIMLQEKEACRSEAEKRVRGVEALAASRLEAMARDAERQVSSLNEAMTARLRDLEKAEMVEVEAARRTLSRLESAQTQAEASERALLQAHKRELDAARVGMGAAEVAAEVGVPFVRPARPEQKTYGGSRVRAFHIGTPPNEAADSREAGGNHRHLGPEVEKSRVSAGTRTVTVGSHQRASASSTWDQSGHGGGPSRSPPPPDPPSGFDPFGGGGGGGPGGGDRDDKGRGGRGGPGGPPGGGGGGDDPPSSSDSESGGRDREVRRAVRRLLQTRGGKTKEADAIRVGSLPNAAQFRAWRVALRSEVAAASGVGEDAFKWILETEAPDATFDGLSHSGRFPSLDSKLAAALAKAASGEIGRRITHATEIEARAGRMLKGRQCLLLIYEHYRINEEAGSLYELTDLMSVTLRHDGQLESFLNSWESVLAGMKEEPSPKTMEVLFLQQLRNSSVLKEEVAHYDRSRPGEAARSYDFLLDAVKRYLERKRHAENRKAVVKLLGGEKASVPAAPAERKTREKGKGRGQGRAPSPGKGICFSFRDSGKCARGKECPYEHSRDGGKKTHTPEKDGGNSKGGGEKKGVCRFHKLGTCRFGAKCPFKHDGPAGEGSRDVSPKNKRKPKKNAVKQDNAPATACLPAAFATFPSGACVPGEASSTEAQSLVVSPAWQDKPGGVRGETPSTRQKGSTGGVRGETPSTCLRSKVKGQKKCLKVKFGEKEVRVYDVGRRRMSSTPPLCHNWKHRHPGWLRELTVDECESRAIAKANALYEELQKDARVPAVPAGPVRFGPSRWMADTGSSFDLVCVDDIDVRHLPNAEPTSHPLVLSTANGTTTVDKEIIMQVGPLGEHIYPLLLPSTPPVLSVGRRCMKEGYAFHWKPYKAPELVTPSGKRIRLRVDNYVPYVVEYEEVCPSKGVPVPSVVKVEGKPQTHHEGKPGPGSDPPTSSVPALEPAEEKGSDSLEAVAGSLGHLMTHRVKNPFCPSCQRSKMQAKATPDRSKQDRGPPPTKFGEIITADHFIANNELDEGISGERSGVVILDRGTRWIDCFPQADKTAEGAMRALNEFVHPSEVVQSFYSDGAPELAKAARDLGWRHATSTPGRPETNGVAERAVRKVLEGARTALEHAGLPPKWWPYAARHFCLASNVETVDGYSAWGRRHGPGGFLGLRLPFGCLCDFKPSPTRGKVLTKFSPRAMPGIFLGYHLQPGGLWKGDYYVAARSDFGEYHGSSFGHVPVQRVKEVIHDRLGGYQFPLKAQYEEQRRQVPPRRGDFGADTLSGGGMRAGDVVEGDLPVPAHGDHWGAPGAPPVGSRPSVGEAAAETSAEVSLAEGDAGGDLQHPTVARAEGASSSGGQKDKDVYDVPGGQMVYGRFVRKYKGTTRPPDIWPELWQMMTPRQRERAIEQHEKRKSSSAHPDADVVGLVCGEKSPAPGPTTTAMELVCGGKPPAPCLRTEGEDELVPAMPVSTGRNLHRDRLPDFEWPFSACVARPVSKKEVASNPKALKAVLSEWEKLRAAGCWDEKKVREWSDVAMEARKTGTKAHVGLIFEICVEKGSELPEGAPGRKFKGRVVFQGNNVRDENWNAAMFSELSSAPATMQAAKAADCYGLFAGHSIQQCDAEQAYIQSRLGGDPTWVRLPKERWPAQWNGMHDPVCPLVLALYGHPDSGGYWERHCETHLKTVGFEPIPDWRSCFWHKGLGLMLVVYVDDFKLAGPTASMQKGWQLIRQKIKTEEPTPVGKYLGCDHKVSTRRVCAEGNLLLSPTRGDKGVEVRCIECDMSDFLAQCVDKYLELANLDRSKLRRVDTPFVDESRDEEEDTSTGELQPIASKVLMKVLYAARMSRYDLLRPTCALAACVTKWGKVCDRKLHRLMSYINCSSVVRMFGWVGDSLKDVGVTLYSDADFAGDQTTMRSTTGVFLCLRGRNTFMPLAGTSKKQTCVSHSTPEAEIVAMDHAIRSEGLPALQMWEVVLNRPLVIQFMEDNMAAIRIVQTGKNPSLRHLGRTHKVDLQWVHERLHDGQFSIEYCPSCDMAADIFTKHFTDGDRWRSACWLIGHLVPAQAEGLAARAAESGGRNPPDGGMKSPTL